MRGLRRKVHLGGPRLRTFAALVAFSLLQATAPFEAEAGPARVSTQISTDHVEVGDPFSVTLVISSDGPVGNVSHPILSVPSSLVATGPTMSMRTSTRTVNGTSTSQSVVTLRWSLQATDNGTYSIPAPTAEVDGQPVHGNVTSVTVGSASAAPGSAGFPVLPGMDPEPTPVEDPNAALKELQMDKAPDDKIFLRSIIDKKTAVVGEQVTVSFYVYYRQDFVMTDRKEPPLSDFLRIPLSADPSTPPKITLVGGKRFGVRLVDRAAIFPLKSGDLHMGSTTARFKGRHIGDNVLRESNDETIKVLEPPESGRPPNYEGGAVGRFTLASTIAPRTLDQGGSISVSIRLDGIGNLPETLKPPTQPGVEWLEPNKRLIQTTKDDRVGGTRTFGYVVRLKEAGIIDLGSVELPYFDPESKSYQTAKTSLGTVEVRPTTSKVAKPDDPSAAGDSEDFLAKLPKARLTLSAYAAPERRIVPAWGFGAAIVGPPMLVFLGLGVRSIGGRIARRRRDARESGSSKFREAVRDATAAEKAGDARALCSALEKAVHVTIDDALQIKSRGFTRDALVQELRERKVPDELTRETQDLLETCETLRFAPADAANSEGSDLIRRVKTLANKYSALPG